MSARDEAVEMIRRICPAHLDADWYGQFLAEKFDAHHAEALAEAAAFVDNGDDCDCGGCNTCYARHLAAGLRRMAGEKATADAATATPRPAGRVAQLLDAIHAARGRWTTSTALRFYREHLPSLDHLSDTRLRTVARGDLRDLAAWGHLVRHEEPGRQYYALKTRSTT